ncbi:S1 family peptidase [Nonomuraea sp. NPDC050404]|uniref:S1 family peptidase n=1 Tax=Nonomuraea sp. NPDC050404 TaxID=3155783 RepID=UPI0033CC1A5F
MKPARLAAMMVAAMIVVTGAPAPVSAVSVPAASVPAASVPAASVLVASGVIRGGDAFVVRNKGRCIVGFTVRRGATGGFVTAGSCGQRGDVALTGYGGTPIGVFEASSYPGNDFAWVSLYPGWTPRGVVAGLNVERPVRGATAAPIGAPVCQGSPVTGWRCGVIQQRNATITHPGGTITGLVRTSVCAEPGTSGAPFLAGDQAQGLTSGASGASCITSGITYFQPIQEALSAFGLTLVTS